MNNTVIKVVNIGKIYEKGKISGATTIQNYFKEKQWNEKRKVFSFQALKNVNFEIQKGERIGIIGRNGAGKSTLLKILSRITAPTQGKVYIQGKLSSMLEIGAGFHGELTGRENIYLNGAILGMNRKEIEEKIEDIITFSECEEFIDTPVKRYSSGMYVKLAFSVASHLNSDIFLMDEVLAVGDVMFQKKCLKKMREISENEEKTILYVSHNMDTIRELCNRCIVLDQGVCIHDGDVETGIQLYTKDIMKIQHTYEFSNDLFTKKGTGKVKIYKILIENPNLEEQDTIMKMQIFIQRFFDIRAAHLRFTIYNRFGYVVGSSISYPFKINKENEIIQLFMDTTGLVSGQYVVDIAVVEPHGEYQTRHDLIEKAICFQIQRQETLYKVAWRERDWGSISLKPLVIEINKQIDNKKN